MRGNGGDSCVVCLVVDSTGKMACSRSPTSRIFIEVGGRGRLLNIGFVFCFVRLLWHVFPDWLIYLLIDLLLFVDGH